MQSLEKYKLAFDISPVPLILVSSNGEILLTNNLLNELFEYERTELVGQNVEQLLPASARTHHADMRDAFLKKPVKRNMGQGRDLHGLTQSGQIIPLELGLDTVTIGKQQCALVVALDIRQRKLREQRIGLVMNAAASAMLMVNDKGMIVFVNLAALELFGYEEHELLDSPIECLVPDQTRSVHSDYRDQFRSAKQARAMAQGKVLHAQHKNGRQIPVEIALTPVETTYGSMVVSTVMDLSERVAMESELKAKSEQLVGMNEELTQFAYSASHDLKAPLATIVGMIDVCMLDLEEGSIDDVRDILQQTMMVGLRSIKKVEDVLEIARVGRDAIKTEAVMLEPILREMWIDLAGGNKNNIQFLLNLHHEDPIVIELASFKIILENLLSNAIRYFDQDKAQATIEIEMQSENDRLVFFVRDNGIGIPQNSQHDVFQKFKRIDERSADGLGLVLVKKQVDRLGGTINFSSIPGEGAEFVFSLPKMNLSKKR